MKRFHKFLMPALLFFVFISSHAPSFAHDSVFPGEKLKSIFAAAESFEQRDLYLSSEQQASIETNLGNPLREEDLKPSVYFAIERDPNGKARRTAVLLFVDAEGMGGKIEIGIAMSSTGELMKVAIFENNEQEVISSPSFLEQFIAKKSSDPFQIGNDITAPRGLEKTAQAIASSARRGMLIIQELFRRR